MAVVFRDLGEGGLQLLEFLGNARVALVDLPEQAVEAGEIIEWVVGGAVFDRLEEGLNLLPDVGNAELDRLTEIGGQGAVGNIKLYDLDLGILLKIGGGVATSLRNEDDLPRVDKDLPILAREKGVAHSAADGVDKAVGGAAVSEGVLVVLGTGHILNIDIFHRKNRRLKIVFVSHEITSVSL